MHGPTFIDRRDAGRRLASALAAFSGADTVVLALPRGGVPVAYEVAEALGAPLDLLFVRKLGAPGQPEFGLGAVSPAQIRRWSSTSRPHERPRLSKATSSGSGTRNSRRSNAAAAPILGERAPLPIRDRTVIVVDDGVATGGTIRAALKGVRRAGARFIVLAVPVGPPEVIERLRADADEVVCLSTPQSLRAVGLWYDDFTQTTDGEVVELLRLAGRRTKEFNR